MTTLPPQEIIAWDLPADLLERVLLKFSNCER
jgi:hypothetical protein